MSEHDDPDGGMPEPDWDRYRVNSRAANTGANAKVGDPLRWGGQARLVLSSGQNAISPQFLRAQTADTYGRLWALTGTMRAPFDALALPVADFVVLLEISQGSGQGLVRQFFDLRALIAIGLAGGYAPFPEFTGGFTGFMTQSFAIIGGVVGQQWGARVFTVISAGTGIVNAEVTTTVISSCLAAGQGL